MIIPLTVLTDIDGLGYYAVAETIQIGKRIVYRGNIVDSRDIFPLSQPPVHVSMETKEGRYTNIVPALSGLELEGGGNALIFNKKDLDSISKKTIPGTPCMLKRLRLDPVYRLR